jgi:hypothetical protein
VIEIAAVVAPAMDELAKERPIFHSEADFQLALAWILQRLHPGAQIRLEKRILDDPRVELDVYLTLDGRRFGLELKYPRSKADVVVDEERFVLRTGAPDLERYDVLKDVARLERLVTEDVIDEGCAVVLTNAAGLWRPAPRARAASYDAFRIHDGHRLEGIAEWGAAAGAGTRTAREGALTLTGSYSLVWRDYAVVSGTALRYLLIAVGARTS